MLLSISPATAFTTPYHKLCVPLHYTALSQLMRTFQVLVTNHDVLYVLVRYLLHVTNFISVYYILL